MTSEVPTGSPQVAKRRGRTWVNWALAVLIIPAAALVVIFALGGVLSTAACSTVECPDLGTSGVGFNVLFYGAPVVAAATILLSFVTATRRWGIVVPVIAWALLMTDIALLAFVFGD